MRKAFLIDTTKCTACRGCQVACKEWKEFPGVPTKQTGTHQNPPDLNPYNYKLVRFSEHMDKSGKVSWYFFPDQCRHCLEAPCKQASSVEGSILHDEATGAVIYTEKTTQEDFEVIHGACPYDIPRLDPVTKRISKCDMCIDRVRANLLPMCVKTCAMGAMSFGDRDEILKKAEARLAVVKKTWPKAQLCNPEDVSVIFLVADDPKMYHAFAVAEGPQPMTRQQMLAGLAAPLRRLAQNVRG